MAKSKSGRRKQPKRDSIGNLTERLRRGEVMRPSDRDEISRKASKMSLGKAPENLLNPYIEVAGADDEAFLRQVLSREKARRDALATFQSSNPTLLAENSWGPQKRTTRKSANKPLTKSQKKELRERLYLEVRSSLIDGKAVLNSRNMQSLTNYLGTKPVGERISAIKKILAELPDGTVSEPLEKYLKKAEKKKEARKKKSEKKAQKPSSEKNDISRRPSGVVEPQTTKDFDIQKKIYDRIITDPTFFYALSIDDIQGRLRNMKAVKKRLERGKRQWVSFNINFFEQLLNTQKSFTKIKLVGVDDYFEWPSVEVYFGSTVNPFNEALNESGALSLLGYTVRVDGPDSRQRRRLLTLLFEGGLALPSELSEEYLRDWGKPASAVRLRKLAYSLASFTKQQKRKRHPSSQAIEKWVDDLEFLKVNFYAQFVREFNWPSY
ncbi:MAG: hypothetical protein ACFE0S_00250 [Rhodospirillales bacterium]